MGPAVVVDLEINADFIGAFLVFANVFEIELLVRFRFLFRRAVGIGDERFAPLHLRQVVEEVDDVLQFLGIHRDRNFPQIRPNGNRRNSGVAPDPWCGVARIMSSQQRDAR